MNEIVEFDLEMEIRSIPGLRESSDIDALLLGDLKTIIIDRDIYMDDRMQNRLRYSLAHEIGHKILHPDLYKKIAHKSVDDWICFFKNIPEDQYSWIEQHAYEFAGRLLVPVDHLRLNLGKAVKEAEKSGFVEWDASGDTAREYIANSLSRIFGVSSQVISKRIVREGLWPPK
ncbi:MAG: ImmA/IrrE family metallo-endopeptidase [Kiritimatiellia bacterium]|nr:ImmA/IrrE family metallo-endopeptidase [Kiritimatiellia bacterium]